MDLLGSILGSMEKPPSASEEERKMAKAFKEKKEMAERKSHKEREKYKLEVTSKVEKFMADQKATRLKLPPASKNNRSLAHEIAEAGGLIAHSFGTEEIDRYLMFFKKENPPSEEEFRALRNGEEYDPSKEKMASSSSSATVSIEPSSKAKDRHASTPSYGETPHYQEKYKHLLGGLDCTEKTAVKMEPNKAFGYVPSSNKKDLRSIEQTLNDMKSRKRPKMDTIETDDALEHTSTKRTKDSSEEL